MANSTETFENINIENKINTAGQLLLATYPWLITQHAWRHTCLLYISNNLRVPPWETAEVREANAGIRFRLSKLDQRDQTKTVLNSAHTKRSTTD